MALFQLIFLPSAAVQVVLGLRRYARSGPLVSLLDAALWLGAIVVVAQPDLATRAARAVGIGRGVDLVTYGLLAAFVWVHCQHYLRYKPLERNITQPVRELALLRADVGQAPQALTAAADLGPAGGDGRASG